MDYQDCLIKFRFLKADIYKIRHISEWPEQMNKTVKRSYSTTFIFYFCFLCIRLGTVNRWGDLEEDFGSVSFVLNEIFYECMQYFHQTFAHLVTYLRADIIIGRAALYAEEIQKERAPLDKCLGFYR